MLLRAGEVLEVRDLHRYFASVEIDYLVRKSSFWGRIRSANVLRRDSADPNELPSLMELRKRAPIDCSIELCDETRCTSTGVSIFEKAHVRVFKN